MKLLVDECLSEELAKLAQRRGHAEASHIVWIGKRRWNWQLIRVIIDGAWIFVTRNSVDFRGPRDVPGSKRQYARAQVHACLICLNGPAGMDLDLQLEMFEEALTELERNDDLVNQVLEISLSDSDKEFVVTRTRCQLRTPD